MTPRRVSTASMSNAPTRPRRRTATWAPRHHRGYVEHGIAAGMKTTGVAHRDRYAIVLWARCPFPKYTASTCALVSFPRKRESGRHGAWDWMPAYAGMTFYWRRTYATDSSEGVMMPGLDWHGRARRWPANRPCPAALSGRATSHRHRRHSAA
jgi:hypothetical protein